MQVKKEMLLVAVGALLVGGVLGYMAGDKSDRWDGVHDKWGWRMESRDAKYGMHGAMGGMMMGLSGKTGDALDEAFLEGMIVHHQGAIEMSKVLVAGTKRPELQKLGNDIIAAQTKEIEMMQQWHTNWFAQ
jgi:uncharacterized protein (DUF305 family)